MKPTVCSIQKWLFFSCLAVLAATLAGCLPELEVKKDPFFEEWKIKAEDSRTLPPAAAQSQELNLPASQDKEPERAEQAASAPPKPLPTKKVTMNMRNTEVNVILRALARSVDQNIMMNNSVQGITDINVTNTPWDQVFLGILHTRGLTYSWEGDIIRVMAIEDMRHDREIDTIVQQQKSQQLDLKKVEPLLTRVIRINYAAAKTMNESLEKLLTKQENADEKTRRGSVTVDEQNNALIIHAVRDDIANMVSLIEKLDKPIHQVLVEAHIIETTRDTARELGIQWGGVQYSNGRNRTITGQHTVTTNTTTGANTINMDSQSLVNFPISTSNLPRAGSMALGIIAEQADYLLDIQLSALEAQSKINILSSPSITTLDNQKAIIESGAKIPFQTIDETGNPQIEFEDAVLRLEVTPHVIDENSLRLTIITNKDEVDFTRTVQGNPTIIKKMAETNIILRDSQTTVIGGLTKETTTGSDSGVPGLKDVPGFGNLFKGEGKAQKMEEVLIFITPHIIQAAQPTN